MLGGASPNHTGDLGYAVGAVKSLTNLISPIIRLEIKEEPGCQKRY